MCEKNSRIFSKRTCTCCPKNFTVNETSGIVTNKRSVSFTLMRNINGRMIKTTKTVCNVYMIIGPASWRTAAKSLVARAIRSPVRLA